MPEPWRIIESRITYEDRWLKVRSDRVLTADGRVVEPFHVLEFPTWVNVVALTETWELVLVREYRHGLGKVLTGLPSGGMDPADRDPEVAARRELREETGFGDGAFVALGTYPANPANQTNAVALFLATGVRAVAPVALDENEAIDVATEPIVTVLERFWRGELEVQVSHAAALEAAARALASGKVPAPDPLRRAIAAAWLGQEGDGASGRDSSFGSGPRHSIA